MNDPILFVYVDVFSERGERIYGPWYVNRLIHAVDTFYTHPHEHLILTDDSSLPYNAQKEVVPGWYRGWWAKILLFRPRRLRTVFLDLDTIILGDVSFLGKDWGDMVILRDFYSQGKWGSALLSLAPGSFGREVWDRFSPPITSLYRGDQDWIYSVLSQKHPSEGNIVLWQNCVPGKIVSYKVERGRFPEKASIVCFHGTPKPHELKEVEWVQSAWKGNERGGVWY